MNYSKKEYELIAYFGFTDIADLMVPPGLYRIMAEKAFCENIQGPATDSLRRCLIALNTASCYRMTEEWDRMIILNEEDTMKEVNHHDKSID